MTYLIAASKGRFLTHQGGVRPFHSNNPIKTTMSPGMATGFASVDEASAMLASVARSLTGARVVTLDEARSLYVD
jgi:hypothetical protein